MLFKQLCGLALSFLVGTSPVCFLDDISDQFPQTRNVGFYYNYTYQFQDLGFIDSVTSTGAVYNVEQIQDARHDYLVTIEIHFYCSQACSFAATTDGFNVTSDHLVAFRSRQLQYKPSDLQSWISSNTGSIAGSFTESATFTDADSYYLLSKTIPVFDRTNTFGIMFPAVTNSDLLENMDYNIADLKYDYELVNYKQIIYRLLFNKDIPESTKQTVLNYVNNGDYSQAVTYIENYYNTTAIQDQRDQDTIINNYNNHETNLDTLFNTENNFTNNVETDFQTQQQDLPDVQQSIDDLQDSSFLQSANWVTQQFNRMTVGNIFGKFLIFSLFTGFIMALIGRFRK